MFDYPTGGGYPSSVPYYPPRQTGPGAYPMQQPPMGQMPMMPPQGLIKVNGRAGADTFQIGAPNSIVALFDANDDIFYIKRTDGAGYASTEAYRFSPLAEQPQPTTAEYISREEFDSFKTKLEEALKNVQQSVRKKSAAGAEE